MEPLEWVSLLSGRFAFCVFRRFGTRDRGRGLVFSRAVAACAVDLSDGVGKRGVMVRSKQMAWFGIACAR